MIGGGIGANRHAAAPRPQLRVCYLCGQQFGSASIGIHVPQCYSKKVAQWEVGDPATRGSKPKHPDTVNWKGANGQSAKKLNDEQFHEFEANLVPCPNCGRTFLPDRLPVHLRGCKGNGSSRPTTRHTPCTNTVPSTSTRTTSLGGSSGAAARTAPPKSAASSTTSSARGASRSASTSPARRSGGGPLLLPTCYLCGQQFGTASIGIHVPQCYAKKLAQWEVGDPATRGKAPRHPDEVKWGPRSAEVAVGGGSSAAGVSMEAQCDAQFQEFVNSLEPCPNCGRKFLSDRLIVHLRSCRPGHAAKRVGAHPAPPSSSAATVTEERLTPRPPPSSRTKAAEPISGSDSGDELNRVNPIRNRVPKDSSVKPGGGRTCPHCAAVEHDSSAKYCRECGWNLNSRVMPEPCARCGETVPEGARFCGTCGEPVNGAKASERVAGGANVNAPTTRVTNCPACMAVCDADGNFCDNCGAALGAAEPTCAAPSATSTTWRYMYCNTCAECVQDLTAVYCEDCGGKLQMMERPCAGDANELGDAAAGGGRPVDTLSPDDVPGIGRAAKKEKVRSRASGTPAAAGQPAESPTPSASGASVLPPVRPSRGSTGVNPTFAVDSDAGRDEEDVERVECSGCGRRFAPDALERHAKVCGRHGKQRPVFNMTKQRLADCDVPPSAKSGASAAGGRGVSNRAGGARGSARGPSSDAVKPAGKDWRAESRAFREAMRNARQVDQVMKAGGTAKDLPPPTYSENAHYVPCPHCQRKFAPDVAERHIPRCATTVNRPKPPPRRR